jgi:hypothetical protein
MLLRPLQPQGLVDHDIREHAVRKVPRLLRRQARAEHIRLLGYQAVPSGNDTGLTIPLCVDAGMGEPTRSGLRIAKEYGPRARGSPRSSPTFLWSRTSRWTWECERSSVRLLGPMVSW